MAGSSGFSTGLEIWSLKLVTAGAHQCFRNAEREVSGNIGISGSHFCTPAWLTSRAGAGVRVRHAYVRDRATTPPPHSGQARGRCAGMTLRQRHGNGRPARDLCEAAARSSARRGAPGARSWDRRDRTPGWLREIVVIGGGASIGGPTERACRRHRCPTGRSRGARGGTAPPPSHPMASSLRPNAARHAGGEEAVEDLHGEFVQDEHNGFSSVPAARPMRRRGEGPSSSGGAAQRAGNRAPGRPGKRKRAESRRCRRPRLHQMVGRIEPARSPSSGSGTSATHDEARRATAARLAGAPRAHPKRCGSRR